MRLATHQGKIFFNPSWYPENPNQPNAELPWISKTDATYFTVYEQVPGVYFEYYAGSDISTAEAAYGALIRRYDTRGNEILYHYAAATAPNAFLRRMTGDLGRIVPYFFYSDETVSAPFMSVSKIYLRDLDAPTESRTIYFEYDTSGMSPLLTRIVNPEGCITQVQGEIGQPVYSQDFYRMFREVDAEGYTTYFEYDVTWVDSLAKTIEPEGRITYYEYGTSFDENALTRKTFLGRGTASFFYEKSAQVDKMPMITWAQDPLGGMTYWYYDATLKRPTQKVEANGNRTYYEYIGGTAANLYALAAQVSAFNGARTYYGYATDKYDLVKRVGPRHVSGFSVASYYEYDSSRGWATDVDPLGNTTKLGRDSVGRVIRQRNARGNTSYFHYSSATGALHSQVDPEGSVTYYGYNSWQNRAREVSARWAEPGAGMGAFTTYYAYDARDRMTKRIDRLGQVTYYEWTSRGDLSSTTNPRGTDTEHTYNGLRLRTKTTVRDAAGALVTEELNGYDIYKNRTQTKDGRGNATYFFYDDIDRLTAQKDSLGNTSYFGYDSMGKRTQEVDRRGNPTYYYFDLLSRETARKDALGNANYFFYDLGDNRTHTVNARGNASYFFYDPLDRVNATRDALGNPTYFYFDANSNRTEVRDARGNTAYFFYDKLDRQKATRDALGNLTYFFYDRGSNQTHVLDARSNPTYFFFDRLDRVEATRDALGNSTYFFYDPVGNRTELRDARGNTTYFGFDALSRQTKVRDALGRSSYFEYDAGSNLVATVDARANRRTIAYDVLNRQIAVREALGYSSYFGYDAEGNLDRARNARANTTYFAYDALGRRSKRIDALGKTAYYFYDPVGNQAALRNELGNPSYFGYDELDRLVRVQDSLWKTTYFEYDPVGNRTKLVDPNNQSFQTRFDKLSRPDAIRQPDAGSSYFFYDPVGNRTAEVDSRGNATYFGYDARNAVLRMADFLGRTTYFEYDPAGNVSRQVGAEGESTAFTYDVLNRRTNIAYTAAGSVVSASLRSDPYYVYDEAGNLTQMGDLWGLHRMGYDEMNRPVRRQFPQGSVVYFEYDEESNRTAVVYPGSAGRAWAVFDELDRMARIKAPSGNTCYFTYNAVSNLTQRVYGNYAKLFATYDAAERIERFRNAKANGQALSYFDYTRDSKGLVTKVFREATHTVYYRYDEGDRLVAEIWSKSGTPEVYGYRYAYDLAGNRTRARMNGSNTYYFYDKANQLTVTGTDAAFATPTYYTYDLNGSVTDVIEPSGTTKFAYNAAGFVARIKWRDASATYFFYDGALQRYATVEAGTATYFLWDGPNLLQELNANGTVKEEHTHAQVQIAGIGQLVETYRPSEAQQKLYPVMDPRGSVTKWVQSDGNTIFAAREYDAFGQIIPNSATGTWPGRHGYQGQTWMEIQSANGQQKFLMTPTRVPYDPVTGRFLQNEPDLELRSQEHYLYCAQNPVIRVDADGAAWTDAPGSGSVADALRSEQAFLENRIREADAWWRPEGKEIKGYRRRIEEIQLLLKNYDGNRARLPSSDPNAARLQDCEDKKSWLENLSDFSAGWGDTLTTIPFTDWSLTQGWRQLWGYNDVVDRGSGWYTAGQVTGTAHLFALGGAGGARAAARGPAAGLEYSHFIGRQYLPRFLQGSRSRLLGDYATPLRHAMTDPHRRLPGSQVATGVLGFLFGGGSNPQKWNLFSRMVDRTPGLLILIYGGGEGAQGIYNVATKPSNGQKKCGCP